MNCAVVGAVLAELSLRARIDTDVESLVVVDESETGNPALDLILKQIADEPSPRNAQYWIERLAVHAESVIDLIPNRLVDLKILIASVYLGDALSFAVYAMASQPALYERIRSEADALFDKGDPAGEDFTPSAIDVTHRFLMECLRVYPIVPMSMRDVMNTCGVEGYELPVGSRICIARTASHYMDALHGRCLPGALLLRYRSLSSPTK